MVKVLKTDGTRETFNSKKIIKAVQSAAKEAKVPAAKAKAAAERAVKAVNVMAKGKDVVRSSDIRTRVLKELDSAEPDISKAWKKYDAAAKK